MHNTDELTLFMKNVSALRKSYGYTKSRMANILGISVKTLNKIEACEFPSRLTVNIIYNLHKHFGILPKNMFAEVDNTKLLLKR